MTQVLVCNHCGAKVEIEDTDSREPVNELIISEDETPAEITLCENCAGQSVVD